MIKQLRKVGNSTALLLDKPILEMMGLKEKGTVQLTMTNGSLVVTPVNPETVEEEEFRKTVAQVMKKRRRLLARLAR